MTRRHGLLTLLAGLALALQTWAATPVLETPEHWAGWDATVADAGTAQPTDAGATLTAPAAEGWTAFRCDVPRDRRNWLPHTQLQITLAQVDGLRPVRVRLGLTGLDTELMRREEIITLEPVGARTITLDLRHAATGWQADASHGAVWNAYWRHYVRQLHVEIESGDGATIAVSAVRLLDDAPETIPEGATLIRSLPAAPVAGDVLELHLDIWPPMPDPYQPVPHFYVVLSVPNMGGGAVVRPYFRRDYELREVDGEQRIVPVGAYHWGVRLYQSVSNTLQARVAYDGRSFPLETTFTVGEAPPERPARGFITLHNGGGGYFQFDNRDPFYAIGLNACWPADAKLGMTPADRLPAANSLAIYDTWFAAMAENGINTSQIWLTPFWTALEWNDLYDSYGGIGVYSPKAAWMLDQLMTKARRHDIHLLLTLKNHHQLSKPEHDDHEEKEPPADPWDDAALDAADDAPRPEVEAADETAADQIADETEPDAEVKTNPGSPAQWAGNPWNVANGGPLTEPAEWFSDERAIAAEAAYLQYVMARWGQDPQIIAFNAISETDNGIAGGLSKTEKVEGYKIPTDDMLPQATTIRDWYATVQEAMPAEMPTLRRPPLYVGNCRARELLGMQVWSDPALPIVMNDYYVHRRDSDVGAAQHIHFAYTWLKRFGKPIWLTETGFSSQGERVHETIPTLHETYWCSSMMPMPGTAMYWWWNQVFDEELLGVIRPVALFWAGEDRRGGLSHECLWADHSSEESVLQDDRWITRTTSANGHKVRHALLNGHTRAYGYLWSYGDHIYDRDGTLVFHGTQVKLPRLMGDSDLVVEYWDTWSGTVMQRQVLPADTKGLITAPDFTHDLAYKLWRRQPGEEVETVMAPQLRPEPPVGRLHRRVLPFDGELPEDGPAALAMVAATTGLYGDAWWKQIDDQYNPFDNSWPVKPSINDYQGTLHCTVAGTYSFAIDSDEASWLWIDDQLVVSWPGNHDPTLPNDRQHSLWTHTGDIELPPGPHTLRLLVFNTAGATLARLAWHPPTTPDDTYTVIPHTAFIPPAE